MLVFVVILDSLGIALDVMQAAAAAALCVCARQ